MWFYVYVCIKCFYFYIIIIYLFVIVNCMLLVNDQYGCHLLEYHNVFVIIISLWSLCTLYFINACVELIMYCHICLVYLAYLLCVLILFLYILGFAQRILIYLLLMFVIFYVFLFCFYIFWFEIIQLVLDIDYVFAPGFHVCIVFVYYACDCLLSYVFVNDYVLIVFYYPVTYVSVFLCSVWSIK